MESVSLPVSPVVNAAILRAAVSNGSEAVVIDVAELVV
jgi:hypothetical protein